MNNRLSFEESLPTELIREFEESLPMVFSVKSFGEMFHCDQKTIYRMINSGELGCIKRNKGSIRILKYHVTDWLRKTDHVYKDENL